jgi:hypothetical protein
MCLANKMLEDIGKSFADVGKLYLLHWNSRHMEVCPDSWTNSPVPNLLLHL